MHENAQAGYQLHLEDLGEFPVHDYITGEQISVEYIRQSCRTPNPLKPLA